MYSASLWSLDGITWELGEIIKNSQINNIIFCNGLFIAVDIFLANKVFTSTNGEKWTPAGSFTLEDGSDWNFSITYDEKSDGNSVILMSKLCNLS